MILLWPFICKCKKKTRHIIIERLDKTGFNEQIIFQCNDAWMMRNQFPVEPLQQTINSHHELVSLCGYSVTVQDIVYLIHWFTEGVRDLIDKRINFRNSCEEAVVPPLGCSFRPR